MKRILPIIDDEWPTHKTNMILYDIGIVLSIPKGLNRVIIPGVMPRVLTSSLLVKEISTGE